LTTLCGIATDASALIRQIAERDPILAARCLSQATTVDAAVRDELGQICHQHLSAWHPNKRWIGASMAAEGRFSQARTAALLDEIWRQEPDMELRVGAHNALSVVAPEKAGETAQQIVRLHVDDMLVKIGRASC